MKTKFLSMLVLVTVFLSACMSGSDNQETQRAQAPTVSTPTAIVTPPTTVTPPVVTATPPTIVNNVTWLRVPIHYSLLLGQPHLWNEAGGAQDLNLREYASAGSSSLKVSSTSGLVRQQLMTYRGRNGQYYSAQIQSISNNILQLTTPLQQDVYAGSNAWNFYDDGSHPNWAGSFAIADFAIQQIGWSRLNQGKHVLFGDSWFSRNSVFDRLKNRLPGASISNKGVGGNTSWDLLSRFDADVRWQNPNYVWILTGTNDYWQDISAANYKSNMRELINKVKAMGAVPIVFDSSVGPLNYGSDGKTRLSRSYVTSVEQLASEN